MKREIKRYICMLLSAVMLFSAFPLSSVAADAEEIIEKPESGSVFEIGKSYTIDGVVYTVRTDRTVEVTGDTDDAPERVEILPCLGEYPVTAISHNAFLYRTDIKEISIPEGIKKIDGLNSTYFEKVEIRGDYVQISHSAFGMSPYVGNDENYVDGLLISGSNLIRAKADGEIILGKEITSVAEKAFTGNVEIITILNDECMIIRNSANFPQGVLLRGLKGSTLEEYAKAVGSFEYEETCACDGGVFVGETKSYCDGTIGYTAGVRCEKCGLWQKGHLRNKKISHFDENSDGVCDKCGVSLDIPVVDSGKAGENVHWIFYSDGTLQICGKGAPDSSLRGGLLPWFQYIRDGRIKNAVISDGITSLDSTLFPNCKSLEKAVIADSVESISSAFESCPSLKEVVLPKELKNIGTFAFSSCKSLEKITLPDTLTSIGMSAFSGCSSLKSIVIPGGVKTVSSDAFRACSSLENVVISEGVTEISDRAFSYDISLKNIELPESLKTLGISVFEKCTALESISIPEGVKHITGSAFSYCTALSDIKLPEKLEGIGSNAFYGCTALKAISFPEKITKIYDNTFWGCSSLSDVSFSENLVSIGVDAFRNCTSLRKIILPESLTKIDSYAFSGCENLTDISFRNGYVSIGRYAFRDTGAYNNPDNIKDGYLYIDNCLIVERIPGATSLTLGKEITAVADGWLALINSKITELTVLNPDCVLPTAGISMPAATKENPGVVKGLVNSTAERSSKNGYINFVPICLCGDNIKVEETCSYCDGTVGYTEGMWCERCGIWASGHERKNTFEHIDKDEDGICDFCRQTVDAKIIDMGQCGSTARWYLFDDGTLNVIGTGDTFSYTQSDLSTRGWYKYKSDIKRLVISDGIVSIGTYAFADLNNVTDIVFPPSLVEIGFCAFSGCTSLSQAIIPDLVSSIAEKAFYKCSSLKKLVLSESLEKIGNYAFSGCLALCSDVVLPKKLKTIGNGIFKDCILLEKVEICSLFTTITSEMFQNCKALKEIIISEKIKTVEGYAFFGCLSLKAFSGKNITAVGNYAFSGCESLEDFSFDMLENISAGCFRGCTSLKNITFGSKTKILNEYSFKNCTSLESITLPEGLEKIRFSAFENCSALKNIVLPESVTLLHPRVFYNCTSLETVTVLNNNLDFNSSTTVDGQKYTFSLPDNITLIAETGSTADMYAAEHDMKFKPLHEKKISSVSLIQKPDKLTYIMGASTELSDVGAVIKVTYDDGTQMLIKDRYTVEMNDTDFTKAGVYHPYIVYEGYKFSFEINVVEEESAVFTGIPESRVFNVFCRKDENTTVCFIPDETRKYCFLFEGASGVRADSLGFVTSFNNYKIFEKTLEKDVPYSLTVIAKKDRNVRICDIDNVFFSLRDDGTYEAKGCMGGGYVNVPASYGGIPVTKIADNFSKNIRISTNGIAVSEGIEEIGNSAFKNYKNDVVLPSGIKIIGEYAFCDCNGNVNVPDSVKKVGAYAFASCENATGGNFPDIEEIGNHAFASSGLGDILLGENLISVGEAAFYGCNRTKNLTVLSGKALFGDKAFEYCAYLENVTLSEETDKLGSYMFSGCHSLKTVTGANNIKAVPEGLFQRCRSLGDTDIISSAESIGKDAFYQCESLEKIILNDKITKINNYSFGGCKNVKEIVLGENIEEIGEGAFAETQIKSIVLPDKLSKIGDDAFRETKSLESIVLPEKITSLGRRCFNSCSSLKSVYAKGKITAVGQAAFCGCTNLSDINFIRSLCSLESEAFAECESLEALPFENIENIGDGAFRNCTALNTVTLSKGGIKIGVGSFEGCAEIKEITVGERSTVSENAFKNCKGLEKITLSRDALSIGKNILDGCENLSEIHFYTHFDSSLMLGQIPESVKVFGYWGSSAQQFADKNGYTFCPVEGHSHVFTVKTVEPKRCLSYAKQVYTCDCGYEYSENIAGSNKKHYYSGFTVVKAPTCTQYGVKSKNCYCGKSKAEITAIEPLGHTEVIDIPAVAPTATTPGYTHQSHCSVCGEVIVKREKIDRAEYKIEVGKTTVIAEKLDAATPNRDGEYVSIVFSAKDNVCLSEIDRTVIYKVGEVSLSKTKFTYTGKEQKPSVSVKDSKGNKIASSNYTVSYSDNINAGTAKVTIKFKGNYSGTKTVNFAITPKQVTGLKASDIKTTSLKLSWSKTAGAKYYKVEQSTDGKKWKTVTTTDKTSYTVKSLKAGTKYQFRVTALDSTKKIAGKASSVLKTGTLTSAPTLTLKSTKSKTAVASWKKVTGAKKYVVYKSTNNKKWTKVTTTTKTSYNLTKLTGGKRIYVKVTALNAYGEASAYSSSKNVTVKK